MDSEPSCLEEEPASEQPQVAEDLPQYVHQQNSQFDQNDDSAISAISAEPREGIPLTAVAVPSCPLFNPLAVAHSAPAAAASFTRQKTASAQREHDQAEDNQLPGYEPVKLAAVPASDPSNTHSAHCLAAAASFTQEIAHARSGHDRAEDNQPAGYEPVKITLVPASDTSNAHSAHCLHGESAKTNTTTGSSRTDSSPIQSALPGSVTSPEPSPIKCQDDAPCKGDAIHVPDQSTSRPRPETGLQSESAVTTTTACSCPEADHRDTTQNDALTSPTTDQGQDKDDESVKEDWVDISDQDANCGGPCQGATRPTSSTHRAKTARPTTTSTARRGSHSARLPKKTGHRVRKSSRALQKAPAQQSPSASPAPVPAPVAVEAVNEPHDQHPVKATTYQQTHAEAIDTSQEVPEFQVARARRGKHHKPPHKVAVVDMDGVPHVMGGLVEASAGRNDILFAKQVLGDATSPYNTWEVERHEVLQFPPPDMSEDNRQFDKFLEEYRPYIEPFDDEVVDSQVNGYAAATDLFVRVMNAHQAELDRVYGRFLSQKAELQRLNNARERAISSQFATRHTMTPRARSRLLAEVGAAEPALQKEFEATQLELKEVIMRGRVKIASGLRRDLRAPDVIAEKRDRALRRVAVEKLETGRAIQGAMIGLRTRLKEQTPANYTAIMGYARHVVDQHLSWFDESDDTRPPPEPRPGPPPSNVDTVVASVPDWFTILDAKGKVKLSGTTPLARFRELIKLMGSKLLAAREEQWNDEFRPDRYSWDKHYHEPHPGWATELQRKRGGWWTCRSGPDAPAAERHCRRCHSGAEPAENQRQGPLPKEVYQQILDEIDSAMAVTAKRDKLMVKHQLEQERQDIDRYWRMRELARSGGGIDITEVLHSPDVNVLNYVSSARRSQEGDMEGGESFSAKRLGKMPAVAVATAQETPSQETPSLETTSQEASLQETSPKKAPPHETVPQTVSLQESSPQESSLKKTTPQEAEPVLSAKRLGKRPMRELSAGLSSDESFHTPEEHHLDGAGFYESLLAKQPIASPSRPNIPTESPLFASRPFHALLTGKQPAVDSAAHRASPSQTSPGRPLSRSEKRQLNLMLSMGPPPSFKFTRPTGEPNSFPHPDPSQVVPGLTPGIPLNGSPLQCGPPRARDRQHSSHPQEDLPNPQLLQVEPSQGLASLHRYNSSQAHDLIHGRDPAESDAEHSDAAQSDSAQQHQQQQKQPAERRQLRSSMSKPGAKKKDKRVSWQN